jgi:hypothetical protein
MDLTLSEDDYFNICLDKFNTVDNFIQKKNNLNILIQNLL